MKSINNEINPVKKHHTHVNVSEIRNLFHLKCKVALTSAQINSSHVTSEELIWTNICKKQCQGEYNTNDRLKDYPRQNQFATSLDNTFKLKNYSSTLENELRFFFSFK